MSSLYLSTIEKNYNFRGNYIPFDGSTYKAAVARDIELLMSFADFTNLPQILLDVGCGMGWHLEYLAEQGLSNLWGVDVSAVNVKHFASRCAAVNGKTIKLVCGDVTTLKLAHFYSVVTSFLSCIGQFGSRQEDLHHICSIENTIRRGGMFMMSFFSKNRIKEIIGSYSFSYSESHNVRIPTTIAFVESSSILTIDQFIPSKNLQSTERIRIYSEYEMSEIAREAGFYNIEIIQPPESPGQSVLVARARMQE